jgi:hypothetical protein
MNKTTDTYNKTQEDFPTCEISDEMLEAVVASCYETAANYTFAVCTGLADCPGP